MCVPVLLLALKTPSSSNNQFSRLRNARQVHRSPPQLPPSKSSSRSRLPCPPLTPPSPPLAAAPQAHPRTACTNRPNLKLAFFSPTCRGTRSSKTCRLQPPASNFLSSSSGFVSSAPIHGRRRVQHQQSSCSSAASAWPTGGAWTQGWGLFLRLPLCGFDLNPVTALQLIATTATLRKGARFTIAACTECYHHSIKDLHCDYLLSALLRHLHLEIQASPPHLLPVQPRATPRQPLAPKRQSRAILDLPLRSNNHGRTIQAGV